MNITTTAGITTATCGECGWTVGGSSSNAVERQAHAHEAGTGHGGWKPSALPDKWWE